MSYTALKIAAFGIGYASMATVGYALYNADGTLNAARTMTGVAEAPAGSGIYEALVTIPDHFSGSIRWDTGGTAPVYASDEINDLSLLASQITTTQQGKVVYVAASTSGKTPLEVWQGDTLPAVAFAMQDALGNPVNLTGATLLFRLWIEGAGSDTISNSTHVTITDAANGLAQYNWQPGDTNTVGAYRAAMQVTFADGSIQTFPSTQGMAVRIIAKNN